MSPSVGKAEPIGIALLGSGIVGSGVLKILAHQSDTLEARTGLRFDVKHVVVRDPAKARDLPAGVTLSTDAEKAIDDPAVNVVVELMGGTGRAGELVERALRLGKPVVTANKSLLAARGAELFALARKHKTCIAFEASCGGGIPIIDALQRGLSANRIDALVGIVNGTCNYILTKMTREAMDYADALKGAQDVGFAEADPTLDVSGRDAAQKLAVLAGLAFGKRVAEPDIQVEGIDKLDAKDIAFAGKLGYVIKLLAIGERQGTGADAAFSLRVHPTLVHKTDVLADVSGGFNAISVYGDALGHALFYGRGAGQMPTASAVVADLLAVGSGSTQKVFDTFRFAPDLTDRVRTLPIDEAMSRFYLRFTAKDAPGVMAGIADALGVNGISIASIVQQESPDGAEADDDDAGAGGPVPIVATTHRAREGAVRAALKAIDALPTTARPSVCLRISEPPAGA